jgi:hypothetical protein
MLQVQLLLRGDWPHRVVLWRRILGYYLPRQIVVAMIVDRTKVNGDGPGRATLVSLLVRLRATLLVDRQRPEVLHVDALRDGRSVALA